MSIVNLRSLLRTFKDIRAARVWLVPGFRSHRFSTFNRGGRFRSDPERRAE